MLCFKFISNLIAIPKTKRAKIDFISVLLHSKCKNIFNTQYQFNVKINNLSTFFCG